MRYLAVDPGGRRIGLALGDSTTGVVSPLKVCVYEGCSHTALLLRDIVKELQVAIVVVGLPTNADGEETPACRRSHVLKTALTALGLVVELAPEHLSTREARQRAREAGRPASQPVDDIAAQVVLEDFLWRIKREGEIS